MHVSQWKNSFIAVALQLLDHMRPDVDAALAAAFAADFGQGDAAMAFRDAFVVIDQIFGHGGDRAGAHGLRGGKFLLRGVEFGLNRLAFHVGGRFDFFHRRLGGLHLAVVLLAGDHAVEQAVFGLGDFVFGV